MEPFERGAILADQEVAEPVAPRIGVGDASGLDEPPPPPRRLAAGPPVEGPVAPGRPAPPRHRPRAGGRPPTRPRPRGGGAPPAGSGGGGALAVDPRGVEGGAVCGAHVVGVERVAPQ